MRIVNPFAGSLIGWDWAAHKAHGYIGGTDYQVPAGTAITSPADGIATEVSATEVQLTLTDGRAITIRECRSLVGVFPRHVLLGMEIAVTGNVVNGVARWPHIDATVDGVRVPFEPLITTSTATVGQPVLIDTSFIPATPIPEGDHMSKDASIVRNYTAEIGRGEVATALIYPNGDAVLLHATDDVDGAVIAHVQVYGLQPTTADAKKATPRDRFGSQLNDAQWAAFWLLYPGTKIGF